MDKFKKVAVTVTIIGAISLASLAFAQTSSPSATSLIEQLQRQIAALKTQLENLKKAQSEVAQTSQDIRGTLKLIGSLKEGSTGDQVNLLQTLLAADPEIFPEGLVTGFFGRLTAQAVKRFQKKHGFEQVGHVGPKTLKKLNEFLDKNPLKEDDDEDDDGDNHKKKEKREDNRGQGKDKRLCAIIPPGHLIAPGWLRKHDGEIQIVPPCQDLPPGILKKLHGTTTPPTGTSTPPAPPPAPPPPPPPPPPPADTTAPVISSTAATEVTASSARIRWVTNESASSWVWYSTSTPVLTALPTLSVGTTTLVADHGVLLESLSASSTYYYKVSSTDAASNLATSGELNFTTQ